MSGPVRGLPIVPQIVPHVVPATSSRIRKGAPIALKPRSNRLKSTVPIGRKAATMRRNPLPSEVAVKPTHPYVALWCVVFFALVSSVAAQDAAAPTHNGVPQDWSQGHIAFSRDTLALHPDLIYREPRVLHQAMQRWQPPNSDVFRGADPMPTAADKSGPHSDWSVSPLGGRISPNMSPAKFSFDPGAPPDCLNDYVVFGLATVGANGGAANLVAFNKLYAGTLGLCGAAPATMFAYNTRTPGGRMVP